MPETSAHVEETRLAITLYQPSPVSVSTSVRGEASVCNDVAHCVVTLHRALFSCHRTPSIPLLPLFVKTFFLLNTALPAIPCLHVPRRTMPATMAFRNSQSINMLRQTRDAADALNFEEHPNGCCSCWSSSATGINVRSCRLLQTTAACRTLPSAGGL